MVVEIYATHRKPFDMRGDYCAGQILNCIMSVYDMSLADLSKFIIKLKQFNGEELLDLQDIPAGSTFKGEKLHVFVAPKIITLTL